MQPRMLESEKQAGNSDATTTNVPNIETYLSLACTQCPSSPSSLIISLMRLCLPPALTHRGTTVKLGVHFQWRTGAPVRPSPLALQLNREDGVIRVLPGGCQLLLGRAHRVASWRVDACPCQTPMQRLPSTDICCMRKNCVGFVCGCILILHLCSLSLAEWAGSSARLACINCPCLARCLLLIILINFNSPGSHCHSSCYFFFFFNTGTHAITQTHSHVHTRTGMNAY